MQRKIKNRYELDAKKEKTQHKQEKKDKEIRSAAEINLM
jgi:hypothetical protein